VGVRIGELLPGMTFRQKTYLLLLVRALFNAFGDVELSLGMKHLGPVGFSSPAEAWHVFLQIISSGTIWFGILLMLGFFASHLVLYSKADFSYVLPTTAANYVIVPLLGLFLLHENVSVVRWAGVVLISFGVLLVGGTKPRAQEAI
jgi:drug/metabolite transporter (DMT)-like permease